MRATNSECLLKAYLIREVERRLLELFSKGHVAGTYLFDPVINFKQGAILGLCSPQFGSPLFQVVLKFDHRLSDGVRAAMFLKELEGV